MLRKCCGIIIKHMRWYYQCRRGSLVYALLKPMISFFTTGEYSNTMHIVQKASQSVLFVAASTKKRLFPKDVAIKTSKSQIGFFKLFKAYLSLASTQLYSSFGRFQIYPNIHVLYLSSSFVVFASKRKRVCFWTTSLIFAHVC